jgi:O-antigen/teichoic acid export membrane protein
VKVRELLRKHLALGGDGLRRLGTDSLLYGGSRALAGAFALFTFPFVARILSPQELGQFAIIQMFTLFLVPLAALGQDTAVMKFLSGNREASEDSDVNVTALVLQFFGIFVTVLLACAAAAAFSGKVTEILDWKLVWVALLGIPAGVLFSAVLNLSKFRFLRSTFLLISLIQVILYTTFLVTSVIILRYGVYGYTLSTAGALLTASVIGLYMLRSQFSGGRASWRLARLMLRFGAPYLVVGLFTVLLPFMDRFILTLRASIVDIGIYSVAIRYASLLEMGLVGFKMAWWPVAFSSYTGAGDTGLFGRTLSAYTVAAGSFVIVMYSISEIGIRIIAGEAYAGAVVYILPLLLAGFLRGLQVVVGSGIAISGRSLWAPVGLFTGIVVGVAATLILWPTLGIVAAAWGVFAAELAALVITAVISQRFLPLRWQFGKALILASTMLLYIAFVDKELTLAGSLQTVLFLMLYCCVGWYAVRSRV